MRAVQFAFQVGDRVVANVLRGYAELTIAESAHSAKAPESVDLGMAAALPCAGLSGLQLVEEHVRPEPGQTVLITGAVGASGRAALHAALAMGARVIAAVRPRQMDEACKLGAQAAIPLDADDPTGLTFDHVADTVGGAAVAALCRRLAPGGRICTIATTPIDPEGLSAEPKFCGFHRESARLERLVNDLAAGVFQIPVARRLPLALAAEAHRLMEAGGLGGKIVLEP